MAEGTLTADVRTTSSRSAPFAPAGPVRVSPWPSERPLFVAVLMASAVLWTALLISVVGILYAGILLVALFTSRLVFITSIRGSGVRLGAEQMPELYGRIVELSRRAGMKRPPEAYLMESRGVLDTFATRFLGRPMVVLHSELLAACDGDDAARDMLVGREIGQLRTGLRWSWLLAPGSLLPFLGSAYSRARELTCDRWGMVLCGHRQAAVRGLTLLAAGRHGASRINREAFVAQSSELNSAWMTIGRWLSPRPPLCERVALLDPGLVREKPRRALGAARAMGLLAGITVLPPLAVLALVVAFFEPQLDAGIDRLRASLQPATTADNPGSRFSSVGEFQQAKAQVEADLAALVSALADHVATTGELPVDLEEVRPSWERKQQRPFPVDPFDGFTYGYSVDASEVLLWSAGPDGESLTADDLRVRRTLLTGP